MRRRATVRNTKNNGRHNKARERRHLAFSVLGAMATLFTVIAVSTQRPLISGALAQTDAHAGHEAAHHSGLQSSEAPEPLYDGSVRPQDIPDSLAISMLMNSLRPHGAQEAALQLQAKVGRMNLSEDDFAILERELVDFDIAARSQEARIEAVRPSSAPGITAASARFLQDRFIEEQRARDALAEAGYERLLDSLSPEGRARLEEHLLHLKTRIRVFPPIDMSKVTL